MTRGKITRTELNLVRYLRESDKLTYASVWTRWNVQNQVAGFVEKYNEGLTFATVRGAGHMVPSSQLSM